MGKVCVRTGISPKERWIVNKHMETHSSALAIREMGTKTIVRCRFTPPRMVKIKKKKTVTTSNTGTNVKKLDHSCIADGNVKWSSHSGKQFGSFLKT